MTNMVSLITTNMAGLITTNMAVIALVIRAQSNESNLQSIENIKFLTFKCWKIKYQQHLQSMISSNTHIILTYNIDWWGAHGFVYKHF